MNFCIVSSVLFESPSFGITSFVQSSLRRYSLAASSCIISDLLVANIIAYIGQPGFNTHFPFLSHQLYYQLVPNMGCFRQILRFAKSPFQEKTHRVLEIVSPKPSASLERNSDIVHRAHQRTSAKKSCQTSSSTMS